MLVTAKTLRQVYDMMKIKRHGENQTYNLLTTVVYLKKLSQDFKTCLKVLRQPLANYSWYKITYFVTNFPWVWEQDEVFLRQNRKRTKLLLTDSREVVYASRNALNGLPWKEKHLVRKFFSKRRAAKVFVYCLLELSLNPNANFCIFKFVSENVACACTYK